MAEKDEPPKKGNKNIQVNENKDSKSGSQNLKKDRKPETTDSQEKKESEITASIETNESENGDPVLSQNYLQLADHYLRRYNELNEKRESTLEKTVSEEKTITKEQTTEVKSSLPTN